MAGPPASATPARTRASSPRRHRIARACIGFVGGLLVLVGVCSLIPSLTLGGFFLGVFQVHVALSVLRLVAGAMLVVSTFAPTFVWGRALSIGLGLVFGFLGLAGGVTSGLVLGVFRVTPVDNTLSVLLCTVLVGVGALSLDRFNQLAG